MKSAWKALRQSATPMLVCLLCCQMCLAQVDPWERVRLIESGMKVQVKLISGKTVNAKMDTWSADGLSVLQGKQASVGIPKSEIAQVWMATGISRKRKAAYAGLITGGAIGGLIGGACAASDYGCYETGAVAVFSAGFLGGIAAGIAALFPQSKALIYSTAPAPRGNQPVTR